MKKILQSALFVSMALACSSVGAQTKPKKPVNSFEGAEKALLVKSPKSKTTNQVISKDQRRVKPTASQGKAKPKSTKGS